MISIIMPAYNAERYIKESIQSVLEQTFEDWELLIIDDKSSDNTSIIVNEYVNLDKRICYLKNEVNMGVAKTRNRGVQAAHGEWIAFLDSDDCWRKDKLQLQMETAKKNKADFLFTGSAFMNEFSRTLGHYLAVPNKISYKQLLKQNLVSCSSVLIRRELMLEYPMKRAEQLHEDFAVWLQILRDKDICAWGINEPLLIYRVSSGSKSGNKIKAAMMTYRVYRYVGLHPMAALYYMGYYTVRSLRKWRRIVRK